MPYEWRVGLVQAHDLGAGHKRLRLLGIGVRQYGPLSMPVAADTARAVAIKAPASTSTELAAGTLGTAALAAATLAAAAIAPTDG